MAEHGAVVTDTHPLVFHAAGNASMGPNAAAHFRAAEQGKTIVYGPAAVIWEMALLERIVRINLRRPLRQFFADLFSNPAYQPLELTPEQVFAASDLRFTKDPFDGLIVAAARDLSLPLITRDTLIRESGAVSVIW